MLEHRLVTPHHGWTTLRSAIHSLRFLVSALVSEGQRISARDLG